MMWLWAALLVVTVIAAAVGVLAVLVRAVTKVLERNT